MEFVGIDVGEDKYFVVSFSDKRQNFQKESFVDFKEIFEFIKNKDVIIAIDAPSGCCLTKGGKRECEEKLGIGGYFKTPDNISGAKPWMKTGFHLWDFLIQSQGFERAKSYSVKNKELIEVHPTIMFKKIKNPEINESQRWIGLKSPVSKKKSKGRNQRKEILKDLFPIEGEFIDKLKIDHVDALISAYIAEQAYKGNCKAIGKFEDGQIWVVK
ncbi:MAG: DUF429 domain-containing protein [Candidatus Omnitrophica bacterium]|nr:DUF429 domain-containing protein [Candidatus Omnitrophota bacterium]